MTIQNSHCRPFAFLFCAFALVPGVAAEGIVEWIAENAVPLRTIAIDDDTADLEPLKRIVGDARVIAFGEGAHDAHELWSLRNRLFAYLVEELGVTAIAAETGLAQAQVTDAYVQGYAVDPIRAARGVFSWSGSVFEENRELIEWMRAYNERPTTRRKLSFYGLEMTGCMGGEGRPLVEGALEYVNSVDSVSAEAMQKAFAPALYGLSRENAHRLTAGQWDSLVVASQDLVSLFERRQVVWVSSTGFAAFERAYRLAIAVRQLTAHYRMRGEGRDIAAAENLRWALQREMPNGRLFVFAHNSHVAKWRIAPENDDDLHSTMGEFAADYLEDDLVVIGSLYDGGKARDLLGLFHPVNGVYDVPSSRAVSLNGVASSAGLPLFLLDVSRVRHSTVAQSWFSEPRDIRNLNVRAGYHSIDTLEAFDALLFVRSLTPLRLAWAPEPATNADACFVD